MSNLGKEVKKHSERLEMSQTQLSKAIGKSKNYLSEMIHRGCSKEKELEIIALLNDLKSDDEIIADLSEQLGNANDERVVLRSEISDLNYYLDVKDKKIKELKHKNYDVCQKLYESQEKNRNLIAKASRAEIMMNIYFIVAMILGVLLGVFWS